MHTHTHTKEKVPWNSIALFLPFFFFFLSTIKWAVKQRRSTKVKKQKEAK